MGNMYSFASKEFRCKCFSYMYICHYFDPNNGAVSVRHPTLVLWVTSVGS